MLECRKDRCNLTVISRGKYRAFCKIVHVLNIAGFILFVFTHFFLVYEDLLKVSITLVSYACQLCIDPIEIFFYLNIIGIDLNNLETRH